MEQKSLVPLALGAAAVVAAIEYPVSQHYATVPSTTTGKRMLIAGAMAFAGVLVAGHLMGRSAK